MRWLTSLLRGGADELGWEDLLRRVSDALADGATFGARGKRVWPEAVLVELAVPAAHEAAARQFAADPRFDREVAMAVANRCDVAAEEVPPREYAVAVRERAAVRVRAQEAPAWELVIEGGDRAGQVLPVPAGAGPWVLGRGGDGACELVVCERAAFVSRRAGELRRQGTQLAVAALDQGDLLLVRKPDGEQVRPARTASGQVVLHEGATVELTSGRDGRDEPVRLHLRRRPREDRA